MHSYIYRATSKTTGKSYIGFTSVSLGKRKAGHKSRALKGTVGKFYSAIRKYGWDDFDWDEVYVSWDSQYCLDYAEQLIIEMYNSLTDGYNSTVGGGRFPDTAGSRHPLYGRTRTAAERRKISENHADVSGRNHPNTKAFRFTDPDGKDHVALDGFLNFCRLHQLPHSTMLRLLYKGIYAKTGNAVGWRCEEIRSL